MKLLRELKIKIYSHIFNKTISNLTKNSTSCFLVPQGLGDILFFLMFVKAYREKNPSEKIAICVTKNGFLNLAELFSDELDFILYFPSLLNYNNIVNDKLIYLHPKIYNPNDKQQNLLDSVRNAMGLKKDVERFIPNVNFMNNEVQEIDRIINNENKIALIAPDATSCSKLINDKEWCELADFLIKNGFRVYFNIGEKNRFCGYQKIYLSIKQTIYFCNKIKIFIGYRSGLCDVVAAFCSCEQFIFFPNNRQQIECDYILNYDTNPNVAYKNYVSLKAMFPEKNIHEFILSKNRLLLDFKEEFNG